MARHEPELELELFPRAGEWVVTKAIACCLFGVAVLVCVLMLAGCVDAGFVNAMRGVHDVVAPAHSAYLTADDQLTPEQVERRLRTLQAWDAAIRAAEEEINGDAAD